MSSQPHHHSVLEQVLNVGSGMVISYFVWVFVLMPIFDINVSMYESLEIVAVFTAISVIRGYIWRRIFNWYQHHRA